VFCAPASSEINLKKAAVVTGEKNIALVPVKEILALTGYLRGGCSPLGLKKKLPVFVDETASLYERVSISAGKRGMVVLLAPADLLRVAGAVYADIV
jgi:Cys-tRNA(Pro)/Cys-tRNA(Cys) deacylase